MIKKLLFAPFVLIFICLALLKYKLILDKYLEVFFADWGGLLDFGLIAILVTFASLAFCLYVTFTQNFKYALPVILIAAIIPFLFFPTNLAIVIGITFFFSFILGYFNLQTNLKTYINFKPSSLLGGQVRTLSNLLLFSLAIGFYMYSNLIIQTQGFKIPDPLLNWAIDMSLTGSGIPVKGEKYLAQANLTPEQAEQLRQNPGILEYFGLESSDIDQFVQDDTLIEEEPVTPNEMAVQVIPTLPTANLKDVVKAQVTDALDELAKPYLPIIPFILALLFYSMTSLTMLVITLFIPPLIALIFSILEKTGFVKYEKEMREVKKLIV